MAHLVLPSAKYKKSFLETLKEVKRDQARGTFTVWFLKNTSHGLSKLNFNRYLQQLQDYRKGKNLPPGWVPATNYWLIEKDNFIGGVDIRYRLTKKLRGEGGHIGYEVRPSYRKQGYGKLILKLALKKASKLGIKTVLVTCNKNNIASRKIIEWNGGIFENEVKLADGTIKQRFWIKNS